MISWWFAAIFNLVVGLLNVLTTNTKFNLILGIVNLLVSGLCFIQIIKQIIQIRKSKE